MTLPRLSALIPAAMSSALLLRALELSVSVFDTRGHLLFEFHEPGETLESLRAIIWAAKMPALAAPALPMAMVATGMPAGICTVASSASRPFRLEESIGTPMTGRVVLAT